MATLTNRIAELARAAGLVIMHNGTIGRQQYQSVTGSLDALARFANSCRIPEKLTAGESADLPKLAERLRNRAALQFDNTDAALMRAAAEALTRACASIEEQPQ